MSVARSFQKKETILSVVEGGLCTGCGTCASLCPHGLIEIVKDTKKGIYLPRIQETKCDRCGLCYKACPGYEVGSEKLNEIVFESDQRHPIIGHYLRSYTGHATSRKIRYSASSGGLVTQILIYALETGFIDGALVTRTEPSAPLEPQPFIARNASEVIAASGSKYCPVATNSAVKEILLKDGRYAVVGLPCQIRAMRMAELVNAKLKARVVLHLGIFCSNSSTFEATRCLLSRLRIAETQVKGLKYRGDGWPGFLTIQTSRENISLDYDDYYDARFMAFIPWRCTMCSDMTNELADMSFGDASLPEFADDRVGTSIVITRNKLSEEILQRMELGKIIKLAPIDVDGVLASQNSAFFFKKHDLPTRLKITKLLGKETPTCGKDCQNSPSFAAYLRSIRFYSLRLLATSERRWWLLNSYHSAKKTASRLKRKMWR